MCGLRVYGFFDCVVVYSCACLGFWIFNLRVCCV